MLGDKCLDVFFSNTAAQACARNFGQIDIVIFGNAAHQRARTNALLLTGFGILQNFALRRPFQAFLLVLRKICWDLVGWLGFWRFFDGGFCCFAGSGFASISRGGRLGGLSRRGGSSAGSFAFGGNRSHHRVDLNCGSGLHLDVLQGAGSGRGNLSVNLVC